MIAGVLVSLVVVTALRPQASAAWAMRAVALGTIGVGFGGAMTYGQTIGLTQDAALVGNWAALRWGLLGLAIKGGIWIGFLGVLLGMGLSDVRYRSRELLLLMLALVGVALIGIWLLNEPYEPGGRSAAATVLLRQIGTGAPTPPTCSLDARSGAACCSASGPWARTRGSFVAIAWPGACWAGAHWGARSDFSLGQCVQAYHAWNPDVFARAPWSALDPHVNWWNTMETTFGAIMGATVAFGAWRNGLWSLRASTRYQSRSVPTIVGRGRWGSNGPASRRMSYC